MQRPSVGREMVEARVGALLEEARRDRRAWREAAGGIPGRPSVGLRAAVGLALVRAGARLLGEVRVS
jgi:hypothetical protein